MATYARLVLLVIIVGVLSALVLLPMFPSLFHSPRFVLRSRPGVYIGSNDSGNPPVGWLMPADTLVSTSYMANETFDVSYMNADVTVLSSSLYQIQPGTVLVFGLYINDQLRSSKSCVTDNISGGGGWAGYGSFSDGGYSYNTLTCGVSLFKTPFPTGTLITVTVWANHPVWVRVDRSPTTFSYETPSMTTTLPAAIDPTSGNVGPRTVTVSVESD
jgi:hypothetical protein